MNVIANMATYPPRRVSMIAAARRIAPQVTRLNIVLNEYSERVGEIDDLPNARQILPGENTRDTGKFYPQIDGADFVLLVDDDIIFPDDLVEKMLIAAAKHGDSAVVGYHGTIYRIPRFSLKRRKFLKWLRFSPQRDIIHGRQVIPFFKELKQATRVHQLGTGILMLPAAIYPSFDTMRDAQLFVDVRFANWCHAGKIKQYALERSADWLQKVDQDESIYTNFTLQAPDFVRREILSYARHEMPSH